MSWQAYLNPGYVPMPDPLPKPQQDIASYTTNLMSGITHGMSAAGFNPMIAPNMIGSLANSYINAQWQHEKNLIDRKNNQDTNSTKVLSGVISALTFGLLKLA